jgi:hypothetical protein
MEQSQKKKIRHGGHIEPKVREHGVFCWSGFPPCNSSFLCATPCNFFGRFFFVVSHINAFSLYNLPVCGPDVRRGMDAASQSTKTEKARFQNPLF